MEPGDNRSGESEVGGQLVEEDGVGDNVEGHRKCCRIRTLM